MKATTKPPRLTPGARGVFHNDGQRGQIACVLNGGLLAVFLADGGARFTILADEFVPCASAAEEMRLSLHFSAHPRSIPPLGRTCLRDGKEVTS